MENKSSELTEEQKKEAEKIINEARKNLFVVFLKFCGGIVALDVLSSLAMFAFLLDTNTDTQKNFMLLAGILNGIFMYRYLYGQLKINSDIVNEKIKKLLEKTE